MTAPASQLLMVRDSICAEVQERLGWDDVAGHHGRFTDAELRKFLTLAPAVRVAVLALERPVSVGETYVDYLVRFGVFVVTRDKGAIGDRDVQALCAVEAIALLADRQRWGVPFCFAAEGCSAQNLYSAAGQEDGIALWALDLRQPVRLLVEDETAAATLRVFVGLAPRIGLAHKDDYVELGEAPL